MLSAYQCPISHPSHFVSLRILLCGTCTACSGSATSVEQEAFASNFYFSDSSGASSATVRPKTGSIERAVVETRCKFLLFDTAVLLVADVLSLYARKIKAEDAGSEIV